MSADDRRLPEMRAGDADRERVLEIVRQSHAEGRLSTAEFYERLEAVYQSKTYSDLDRLTHDLPSEPEAPGRPSPPAVPVPRLAALPPSPADRSAGVLQQMPGPLRAGWALWASVVFINLVIWLIIALTSLGNVDSVPSFWPIWVAGPWGAVLLGITATWWFNRDGGGGEPRALPPGTG